MTTTGRTKKISQCSRSWRARYSSSPIPVQAPPGLPDLASLPLHKYKSAAKDGDKLTDLVYESPRVTPRECDYVVDPKDWTAAKRRGRYLQEDEEDRGAPLGANTVESILAADIDGYQCEVCDNLGSECEGPQCIAIFKAYLAAREKRFLEVRDAGAVGVGLFAKRTIRKGTLLCEYTGRLMPIDFTVYPADSSYTWHVGGTCRVDSAEYGNIGRFANHHCTQFSCDAVDLMYGRRKVLCYKAKRDIPAGEQIYVNYGVDYFVAGKPCLCSASDEPHLLGPHNRIRPVPTKQSMWAAQKKQRAEREKMESPWSTSARKVKVTKRTGVVARSRL